MLSSWPLYHIVDDASRRNLLAVRGPGAVPPPLPQGAMVRAFDCEPREEIDRLMRQRPGVVKGERTA